MAKYMFVTGAIFVLIGSYLVITHANVVTARILMATGVVLELSAIVLIIRRLIKNRVI